MEAAVVGGDRGGLGNDDALVDALSGVTFGQHGPQHASDDVRRRVGRVESRVKVGQVARVFVLDAERRVLNGERPGQMDALVDVTQETGAVTQPWEVIQGVPDTLTDLLHSKASYRSKLIRFCCNQNESTKNNHLHR